MDAYPMPFTIDRSAAPRYRLVNASLESLRWVRIELNGPGIATPPFVPRLGPGETLEVDVRGADLPRATRMVVRWLRENGDEYLWGVAF